MSRIILPPEACQALTYFPTLSTIVRICLEKFTEHKKRVLIFSKNFLIHFSSVRIHLGIINVYEYMFSRKIPAIRGRF
jgi:hypothetical protein